MLIKRNIFVILILYLESSANAITVIDEEDAAESTTAAPLDSYKYRKTLAKTQSLNNRVPEHLQFVRNGFIYEDADDVIHVIDPPKHFQELKKYMTARQNPLAVWEQPSQVRVVRPTAKAALLNHKNVGHLNGSSSLRNNHPNKTAELSDLEIQQSQYLPLEILASVRKTENYLRKFKPKLPLAKQRIKTKKIQTVIWEKSQEKQQFQRGQQQKVQGIREFPSNRRKYNKRRFKRSTPNAQYKALPLQGIELLNHINELIKNASLYLKLAENYDDYADEEAKLESTTLQGEILLTKAKRPQSPGGINEDMVVKILENSVKATNVIMQQIQSQNANYSKIAEKCDHLKVTYPNHIQNLQNQIKCMQNFIKDVNATQQQQQQQQQQHKHYLQTTKKRYGERLEARKSKDLRQKPFLVAQLADDYFDDTAPAPVNTSLIYDDVMTTIRNMLQAKNLQSLEDTATTSFVNSWEDSLIDSSLPSDNSHELVNFHNLQQYLSSLQSIVTNLPKFNYKSLNLQEIEGASSKYFFINPQGDIYSLPQPFKKEFATSPSSVFTHFPDIPIVADYLKNGTLLPPSQNVVEIL